MAVTITLISRKQHCISCEITDRIVREAIESVDRRRADIEARYIELDETEPSPVFLKTERYPAVLIDGKQISAGEIVTEKRLLDLLANI
ncbi:MAG: hypothetical protein ACLFRY_03540 [Spirochaetia bacterium]